MSPFLFLSFKYFFAGSVTMYCRLQGYPSPLLISYKIAQGSGGGRGLVPVFKVSQGVLCSHEIPATLHLFLRNLMSLSQKTIQNLAVALTPEIIDDIFLDERFVEMMMEVIPEFIATNLETQDYDLVAELAMCVMDNIKMVPRTT